MSLYTGMCKSYYRGKHELTTHTLYHYDLVQASTMLKWIPYQKVMKMSFIQNERILHLLFKKIIILISISHWMYLHSIDRTYAQSKCDIISNDTQQTYNYPPPPPPGAPPPPPPSYLSVCKSRYTTQYLPRSSGFSIHIIECWDTDTRDRGGIIKTLWYLHGET